MSMQDPIADMLTRIRNGQMAGLTSVSFVTSKIKVAIAEVLKQEGYISDFQLEASDSAVKKITIQLKYYEGKPVIAKIKRISKPGLRIYKSRESLVPVSGFGVAILSTSKGVISDKQAKSLNVGGEVLCEVA